MGAGWAGVLLTVNIVSSMIAGLGAGYWSDRGRKNDGHRSMCASVRLVLAGCSEFALAELGRTDLHHVFLSSLSSGITVPIAGAMIVT